LKFGELIKKTNPGLVVSPRYDAWMTKNANPHYTAEALEHATKELAKQATPRDRRGTFSASSLNTCRRKQQFTFLGMPELPPTAKQAAIFQNGTFMHIRWQMAGISEGWLPQAEVPVPHNEMTLSGTMDGIAYDGTIVEFKSINTNGFSSVNTFGVKEDHLAQGGTYLACTDAEKVSFVYEDKNTQEYKEIVKTRDELPIREIKQQAEELWTETMAHRLYEPLGSCEEKTGFRYTNCPFREQCLKVRDWEHAQEIING
jgi:hypothetical protein